MYQPLESNSGEEKKSERIWNHHRGSPNLDVISYI